MNSIMIDEYPFYETPDVEVITIVTESFLAGSVEDPVVNPELDWQ